MNSRAAPAGSDAPALRVAVFGRPGGGKSTLGAALAGVTGLPLHQLDRIQFAEGGLRLPDDRFLERQSALLAEPRWIIEGFGTLRSFQALLSAANVLVYVDRPLLTHYGWVTKRLLASPFRHPLGWPPGSPLLKSTLDSYRILWRSRRFWTPEFGDRLNAMRPEKAVYRITQQSEAEALLVQLADQAGADRESRPSRAPPHGGD